MLIFFIPDSGSNEITPVAIFDATQTDDQWSNFEVRALSKKWAANFQGRELPDDIDVKSPVMLSLTYEADFYHNGLNAGESFKTHINARIDNAPEILADALSIKTYTTEQNLDIMKEAVDAVVNAQRSFPAVLFAVKKLKTASRSFVQVERGGCLYSTQRNFDPKSGQSKLIIKGASFSDIMMLNNFSINLNETQTISEQIASALKSTEYTAVFKSGGDLKPKSVYYAPMQLNRILNQMCKDFNFSYSITGAVITFVSLNASDTPEQDIENFFNMRGGVAGANFCTFPQITNYSQIQVYTELYDPSLFVQIGIFNDSGNNQLFSTMIEETHSSSKYSLYSFYVLSYSIVFSRKSSTAVNLVGINNWLLQYVKLDTLFENKTYINALK